MDAMDYLMYRKRDILLLSIRDAQDRHLSFREILSLIEEAGALLIILTSITQVQIFPSPVTVH